MEKFKKYIVPFVDDLVMGCGFIIPNYFITAGHIFDKYPSHTIFFNGKYYSFNKSDAIYLKSTSEDTESENIQDVAIFPFDDDSSPLNLYRLIPFVGSLINNYSFLPITGQRDPYAMIETECIIKSVLFHFFECETSHVLNEGSSGSPLIYGNTVFGILSGCRNPETNPNDVLFCSTKDFPI